MNSLRVRKILSLIALIGVGVAIFVLTAMPTEQSSQMSTTLADAMESTTGVSNRTINYNAYPIPNEILIPLASLRKWAHAAEFAAFGLAAFWFVCSWLRKLSLRKAALVALVLSVCYSVLDQVHKIFVPGREFDAGDFPFDAFGYCLAIGIAYLVVKRWRAKRVVSSEDSR